MAATDQTYRNQKILDRVFAASCIAMLLSVIWMFVQDYNREFKTVQRDFRDVEAALNESQMLDQLPDVTVVDNQVRTVAWARKVLNQARKEVEPDEKSIQARRDKADEKYRKIKADLDAKASYVDIAVDERSKAEHDSSAFKRHNKEVEKLDKEVARLKQELAEAQDKLDEIATEYKEKVRSQLAQPEDDLSRAEDDLKKLTAPFDRYAKVTAQKVWKFGDTFRNWPILDGFKSPTKIEQIVLNDLTIDYGGFRDVPRYDRCTTCHLGIDKASFDRNNLLAIRGKATLEEADRRAYAKNRVQRMVDTQKIIDSPEEREKWEQEVYENAPHDLVHATLKQRQKKLEKARELLAKRVQSKENLGFDLADLPTQVRTVNLTNGQVKQFMSHPRLDLFVDSNSPHPMQKVGCTICHDGQGSATEFQLASHSPANSHQEEQWSKNNDWHASHNWDFPMLSSRFVESSCLKCHHQVTDLIRYGSKPEAPKLLKGYELVRENGCFGCHEIAGLKSGRAIGPDLRLEPVPALDWLTAAEQDKARSDPANPPGTYRKVGPGLRRLAEKTNQEWARKWILDPRGFREDTKMPHFYKLSNNDPDLKDVLPETQKTFPATEIHSIAAYLFEESKKSFEGKDTYRLALEDNLARLHKQLKQEVEDKKGPLNEKEKKELDAVARQLTALALLSNPANATKINTQSANLESSQDRLQELYLHPDADPRREEEIKGKQKELDEAKQQLIDAGKPARVIPVDDADRKADKTPLVHWNGSRVAPSTLPPADKKQAWLDGGKRLFTERGCLACHSHDKTTYDKVEVQSEANFGPNLSRVAAKLAPEVGKPEDRRLWLIQWLLNPNVHHPRTRMPITQLEVADAAQIADWLLSQTTDWKGKDPDEPSLKDLVTLARVYLAKAPGMTRTDVDNYLPEPAKLDKLPDAEKKNDIGIPEDRLRFMVRDAEEHRLAKGKVDAEALKWYIGKKSISRLGCFGCHDVPGFEMAKPIGVALNDWGKKDAERLAFEDADSFVRSHFNYKVTTPPQATGEKADAEWQPKDNTPPFEKFFYEKLEEGHRNRDGFLHLKLAESRSYDYNRQRAWDDRLRMPQFQFARTRQKKGEDGATYATRKAREEAEGREAVMTFILGLVAEPVSLKHVASPRGDKLAEVKGRQVLEKYNCAGCHQVRAGVYEYKPSPDSLNELEKSYDRTTKSPVKTYHFSDHNAWIGSPSPLPDRLLLHGTSQRNEEDPEEKGQLLVRLMEALRFTNKDRVVRDIPAGTLLRLPTAELPAQDEQYGGTFGRLLYDYLKDKDKQKIKKDDDARPLLPPPLIREGERVQPNWLYQFLQHPHPIRPGVILRMPQFNMSPEEAMALAEYFSSVDRLGNPIAGTTSNFVAVTQRDESYWKKKTQEYIARLPKDQLEARFKEMKAKGGVWEQVQKEKLGLAETDLEKAEEQLKAAPKDTEEAAKKIRDDLKARVDELKKDKEYDLLKKEWLEKDAYAADSFRLLRSRDKGICLTCHSLNGVGARDAPPLELAADRLRPDWTVRWISNPDRMFAYKPLMPPVFEKGVKKSEDLFDGESLDQIMAIRDVLLDFPRVSNLPVNRFYRPALTGAPPPAAK